MKKLVTLLACCAASLAFAQQRQTFDIATYVSPSGWQSELKDFATSYTATNAASQGWCRATIYKSIVSSGDALTDFNNEWSALITKNFPDAVRPTPEATQEDGWTSQAGAAKFQFNHQESVALLTTVTGYGVEISIVVLMNSDEFMPAVESFLASIDLQKPAVPVAPPAQPAVVPAQIAPPIVEKSTGHHGISISTINFDDGWVAQPFDDYVKVTKGNTKVLLHYSIEVTDALRSSGLEIGLWNQLILPRYTVSNVRQYDNDGPCYFCIYFFEADGIEKATGKNCHVGLRVITTNGFSKCIEIVSTSAQEFRQNFPDQKNVEAMLNYNKFAVTETDLIGTWDETSGAYVNMYNTVTGSYAGMNASSSASQFTFKVKGEYESTHKGAFGMVGSMQFYNQKYTGAATIANWEVTLTKRFEGKTETFWAQFEAVRGGSVLHLTNKQSSGDRYHLIKKP